MATTMVAEKEGSARPKALMAKILEAVVAILGLSSGCFIMGFACAHLRLKFFLVSPPPISLRAGLQHNFPTFRHMEIGDRRPGQRLYSAGIRDRRADQSLYRAGIGDQRSDARLRPLAGETSRSTHRVSDPVSDLRSPIRSG